MLFLSYFTKLRKFNHLFKYLKHSNQAGTDRQFIRIHLNHYLKYKYPTKSTKYLLNYYFQYKVNRLDINLKQKRDLNPHFIKMMIIVII